MHPFLQAGQALIQSEVGGIVHWQRQGLFQQRDGPSEFRVLAVATREFLG